MQDTALAAGAAVPSVRPAARRLGWGGPLLMTFIRLPIIVLAQFMLAGAFALRGDTQAWERATSFTNVYLPLTADVSCLLLLLWLTRREGSRLRDLIGFDRDRWERDVLLGLGLFVLLIVVFNVVSFASAFVVYGPSLLDPENPPTSFGRAVAPPMWTYWWTLLVLPISAGFVEELTYRGYAQPRLIALTGKPWLGVLIVAFGFGLQHVALPLVDWQVSLSRFLATFLLGLMLGVLYLRLRRLLPLIVAHWALDYVGLGLLPLLAVLGQRG